VQQLAQVSSQQGTRIMQTGNRTVTAFVPAMRAETSVTFSTTASRPSVKGFWEPSSVDLRKTKRYQEESVAGVCPSSQAKLGSSASLKSRPAIDKLTPAQSRASEADLCPRVTELGDECNVHTNVFAQYKPDGSYDGALDDGPPRAQSCDK